MGKRILRYTLRIEDVLLHKLYNIAEYEGRSTNKEIERMIKIRIKEFESEHGEIKEKQTKTLC